MTSSEIAPTTGSAIEQFMAESGVPVGLEDVDQSDIVMSKITIEHELGLFKDSLTGETFDSLDTVLLGVIKGRVLWDTDLDAKESLMCKSTDAIIGHPTSAFPIKEFTAKGGNFIAEGAIKCEDCPLAKWGSHPTRNAPWCTEQMTFPLTLGSDQSQAGGTVTFQRSGVGPVRAYLSAFMREKKPMFAHRTLITLERGKKGTVVFSTPKFVRGAPIEDVDLLRGYAAQYARIRDIWTTPQVHEDETPPATPAESSAAPVIEGTIITEVPDGQPF